MDENTVGLFLLAIVLLISEILPFLSVENQGIAKAIVNVLYGIVLRGEKTVLEPAEI